MVEVLHLQCSCVGEIVNAEFFCTGELKMHILLVWRNIKENTVCNSQGMQT
jgi:hypothetical protein